jgi:hypothetical protein
VHLFAPGGRVDGEQLLEGFGCNIDAVEIEVFGSGQMTDGRLDGIDR